MELDTKIPKEVEKLAHMIVKLEPTEFVGVCKILGVELVENIGEPYVEDAAGRQCTDKDGDDVKDTADGREPVHMKVDVEVRSAEELIADVFDKLTQLNRTQRRNLMKLLKPATKGR